MIEYLEKLVEEKEYQKALDYAEQLLLNPDNTAWDLMVIYTLLLQARFETGEFYGAQVAGQLAAKMSREFEAWDYYGRSTLWLGVCYDRLRQPENAIAAWYDYLARVPYYEEAAKYHAIVLYNIGVVAVQAGRHEEGIRMLQKAAEVAHALQDHRKAHGIRHALIDAHLRYGQLSAVPSLLVKCGHYLRHNPDADDFTQTLLWHLVLRVRYAMATNRPQRTLVLAQRGLRTTVTTPKTAEMVYYLHFISATAHEKLGNLRSAMWEGVRARAVAIEARRFDLEFQITDYIYGLLSFNPDLADQIGDLGHEAWDPSVMS